MRRPWIRLTDKVRIYDDQALRAPAREVTEFGDDLHRLIDRLLRVQKRNHAVGVAASQLGEPWNVFVINGSEITTGGKPESYVNARILSEDGQSVDEEGCLSFPGVFIPIKRPSRVSLTAQDQNGKAMEREAKGLLARVFCHETDHLNGRLIIDKVSPLERSRIIERMARRGRRGGDAE